MADWEAYDRLVAKQQAEFEAWAASDEGKAHLAELDRRAQFIHDYIGQAPDHLRGYYFGLVRACLWSSQVAEHDPHTYDIDPRDWGIRYSPSGSQPGSAGFYAPEPPRVEDPADYPFDPVLFLCMEAEQDAEGGITEIGFELVEYKNQHMTTYSLKITVACSEGETGIPEDFDAWYAWEPRAAELRDQIKEMGVW